LIEDVEIDQVSPTREGNFGGRRPFGAPQSAASQSWVLRVGFVAFGNPKWQSKGRYRRDGLEPLGHHALLRSTMYDLPDSLDTPNGPPEPVAQVRVLPTDRL
jgi:hypothetical protein